MHVILWDTRRGDIAKDFAGGFGVGVYHGRGGLRGQLLRHWFRQERRPPALALAYLAAGLKQIGHTVEYIVDTDPPAADVVIFHPALATLAHERRMMARLLSLPAPPRILVCGPVAHAMPEAFDDPHVTVLRGEAEQLTSRFDEVVESNERSIDLGIVGDLDALPRPDWSPFGHRRFRVGFDFTRFPTALVQHSRGCALACDYCPYLVTHRGRRQRDSDAVVDEIRESVARFGFRSFKFRDPLFGVDRRRAQELAIGLARLHRPVQFAIETRSDLIDLDTLRLLRRAGLTSITFGVETPDNGLLGEHKRGPLADESLREWIAACHELGIRTVAGLMIGFVDDTSESIRQVLRYAKWLGPTLANFNLVTPYPGTAMFTALKDRIATFDYSRYDVYQPVLQYTHLTAEELLDWHAKCFVRYYFRTNYLKQQAKLLWPGLARWLPNVTPATTTSTGNRLRIDGAHSMPGASNAAKTITRQSARQSR
ncbi:MAG: radical SAM protein [Planctomycetes bacterium]|nr:radical SAM protein [Planctomycetota bacterium]